MKLPVLPGKQSLCDQCVALCCRYFAFSIEKPTTKRDFEDLRWYLLHEDAIIFVEDGDWYVQVNRPCKALLPDNRCGIYENRPAICRAYTTSNCDWHGDEYDYSELFTEPDQIQRYGEEYLAKQRKRRRRVAAKKKDASCSKAKSAALVAVPRKSKRRPRAKVGIPLRLLKTA